MRPILRLLLLTSSLAVSASLSVRAGDAGAEETVRAAASKVSPESLRGFVDTLAGFGTRHVLSAVDDEERGIGAARRWLEATLRGISEESGGRLEVSRRPFEAEFGRRNPRRLALENVVARLPGTGPGAERVFVVLGHYDSRASGALDGEADAPGADDDASGTAVVLEAARVLATMELDATVVFLCTDGEELGLFGSEHWVADAAERGLDVRGALSFDIVGDPSGPGGKSARDEVRVFSEGLPAAADLDALRRLRRLGGEADSPSRQLARYVAEVARRFELPVRPRLVFRPDRFLRGGDHTPFNEQGWAAVRFTEVFETYDRQHQDVREEEGRRFGDLPEFVDEGYLADVARLAVASLVALANAPSPPSDARIVAADLTHDTTLRWSPSPEEDVAGYEVLWRATTAPDWEHVVDVGDATEATLDLSKDHWFFGVRAYDQDGYRSPVVFPRAGRD